tara:strand:+ start:2248 stop:3273 length:1026 start_codon:yes stop_codon:yes gene_type:complete
MNSDKIDIDNIKELTRKLEQSVDNESVHYLTEILENLVQFQESGHIPSDLRLIKTTVSEMIQSFKVFKPYRNVRKVCIFGSARTKPDHPNYALAEQTAKKLHDSGYLTITGAGPGIMEAGNKGAPEGESFGLNIILPFEQEPNAFIKGSDRLLSYNYFFTRKLIFVKESDAIVLFPGGFGTQDEGFEVLTLIQTGCCSPRPFILLNHPKSDYWASWKNYVQTQLLDRGYICAEDIDLIQEAKSVDDIITIINNFYSTYHSIAYYDDNTCIRLNKPLEPKTLDAINTEFNDILLSGKYIVTDSNALKGERNLFIEKPRLIFNFNKIKYGRICTLINFINKHS